jgi:hypothetical protein
MRFQKCDRRCIYREERDITENQIRCKKVNRMTVHLKKCPGRLLPKKVMKDV